MTKITRNTKDPESRAFWNTIDEASRDVEWMPRWKCSSEPHLQNRPDPISHVTFLEAQELPPGLRQFVPDAANKGRWRFRVEVSILPPKDEP